MKTYEDKNWTEAQIRLLDQMEAQFLMNKPKDDRMISSCVMASKCPAKEAMEVVTYYLDKPHAIIRNSYTKPLYLTDIFSKVAFYRDEIQSFTFHNKEIEGLVSEELNHFDSKIVIKGNELWITRELSPDILICILHEDKLRTDKGE